MSKLKVRDENARTLVLPQDEFYLFYGVLKVTGNESVLSSDVVVDSSALRIILPTEVIVKVLSAFEQIKEKVGLTDRVHKKLLHYRDLVTEDARYQAAIKEINDRYKIY